MDAVGRRAAELSPLAGTTVAVPYIGLLVFKPCQQYTLSTLPAGEKRITTGCSKSTACVKESVRF